MYKATETANKFVCEELGIPYDKLDDMDEDEIEALIKKKYGKKMGYSYSGLFCGSGDDCVLIDLGRLKTIDEINKEIDELKKNL